LETPHSAQSLNFINDENIFQNKSVQDDNENVSDVSSIFEVEQESTLTLPFALSSFFFQHYTKRKRHDHNKSLSGNLGG
jgi:hypothetical protein